MLAPQQGIMCSRAVIPRCGATLTRHGVQPAIDDEDARRIASGLFVSNFPDSTYNGALLPSTRQHNHHGSQRSKQWLHSQQLLFFDAYTHTRRGSFVARDIAGSAAALVLLLRSQERTASAATTQMSTIGPIWLTFT